MLRTMNIVRLAYIDAPYDPLPKSLLDFRKGSYGREYIVVHVLSGTFEMNTHDKKAWQQMELFKT